MSQPGHSGHAGFTLVELLIAMTIVGILSAIAFPGYSAVLQRAKRNEARLALLRIQHAQERHYARHLRYAATIGMTESPETLAMAQRSAGDAYALSVNANADGQHYTVTARALADGGQAGDRACQQFAVDETGQRRSADADGAWTDADPHHCWG